MRPQLHRGRRFAAICASVALTVAGVAASASSGRTDSRALRAGTQRPARAASSHLPRKAIWGPVALPNGQSAFPTYHQLGVQVFQIDLNWADAAPSRPADPENPNDPAYAWPADVTQAISQAAHYGIRVCLLVQDTPGWANGHRATTWAPTRASDYGSFLVAASRRYPSVRMWMIWGEPNRDGNFEPMPANSRKGPRRYAVLLNAAYHGLKQASRKNIVIGGDTWSFGDVEPGDFVRWMRLPNGKPPPLDYYGHNPFSIRFPKLSDNPYFPGGRDINDIDTLEQQLRGTYHRRVQLWLSEFTVSSDHPNRAFNFSVSRAKQAQWIKAVYRLVDSVNYVAGLGWFTLLDEPTSVPRGLTNGLMTYSLQRKPAFTAYEDAR
jgi:hypothetical protein